MIQRILLYIIAIVLFFSVDHGPALAKQKYKKKPGISPYVEIPLLYMTDRAYLNDKFLNQRKTENGSIYDVYAGRLTCIIENVDYKKLTETQKKLGWHYLEKLPKNYKRNPLAITQFSQAGKKHVYHQLGQQLIETAKECGNNHIFLDVHGFNNPFAGAASSAAKLAYTMESPVLLYSWPSAGNIIMYDVDSTNNEWSQEHYNRLMEELVSIKGKSDLKFYLVAHSMGNRLAIRAATILKGRNLFEQCFLVDPDMDAETFVHYVARYAVSGIEEKEMMAKKDDATVSQGLSNVPLGSHGKLRILFSHHDNALPIVQLLFSGGYTRLGQGADTMLASVFDTSTFSNIIQGAAELFQPLTDQDNAENDAASASEIKDQNPDQNMISNRVRIADTSASTTGNPDNKFKGKIDADPGESDAPNAEYEKTVQAFEWIDYTILDHGILGHTVPYHLIRSLSLTGKAGDGYNLVTEDNGTVNRFTRFASRIFHQGKHFGDVGKCEKVVADQNVQGKLMSKH